MKTNFKTLILFAVLISGCSSLKMVGDVNMISSRNIDSKTDYVLIKTGTDDSKANFRSNKADNIDDAINKAVQNVPGGEFLKNAKIYTDGKSWTVIGDVWGVTESANVEGFKIGDAVLIKNSILNKDKFSRGIVTGFKDRKTCIVKIENGATKELNYSDLSHSSN